MTCQIKLSGRSEILDYVESDDTYSFSVCRGAKEWELNLFGIKNGADHDLTDEESRVLLPRLVTFLKNKRGIFGLGAALDVKIIHKPPLTLAQIASEETARGNTVVKNADGSITVLPPHRKGFLRWLLK